MCMSCLNVNVQCFSSVKNDLLGRTIFSQMTDTVKARKSGDDYIIGGFCIVTFINIRGSRVEKHNDPDNPLDSGEKLYYMLRLTKLDPDPQKQISYNLFAEDTEWDLAKETAKVACFRYVERTEVLPVERLRLKDAGKYVIKFLVRKNDTDQYTVQMVHPLTVKNPTENQTVGLSPSNYSMSDEK